MGLHYIMLRRLVSEDQLSMKKKNKCSLEKTLSYAGSLVTVACMSWRSLESEQWLSSEWLEKLWLWKVCIVYKIIIEFKSSGIWGN